MSVTNITIIIVVSLAIYFVLMFLAMRKTFKYKETLNYYVFQKQLNQPKQDLMHYIEVALSILMIFTIVTTAISFIQIMFRKAKHVN